MMTTSFRILLVILLVTSIVMAQTDATTAKKPTKEEAVKFITDAEQTLAKESVNANVAEWAYETDINDNTEKATAAAQEHLTAITTDLALKARAYDGMKLPPDVARKFLLLKLALVAPAPNNDAERKELTEITTWMQGLYGKGKYCKTDKCLDLEDLSKIMATSREPNELEDAWVGWHKISPPMREKYARFVELSNKGAQELGFKDTGVMWRSNYDLPPDQFAAEMDRLWDQVKPLYLQLHAYVRYRLQQKYGKQVVPDHGPIPAQLLGNMWAQDWSNIYPLVAPEATAGDKDDLTEMLKSKNTQPLDMVHYGENFFKSLGFDPLPDSFWHNSMFTKPQGKEVVCHASAWDVDNQTDVRLKMCIQITGEDFRTIHHELGHNFYQLAYRHQPYFFEDSANDGFHEAIGDTIALSVTPAYLQQVGLYRADEKESDLDLLMKKALEKVAFLPFGLKIDKWRWQVFDGTITPAQYNKAWWDMTAQYQGVAPPIGRTEADFDPGAKYHIAANVPYARYFLADILQFQFHRALCKESGQKGPLHRCSIYNNKRAGEKLHKMLAMGKSQPWPVELKAMTGQSQMDATAIVDYFAPLMQWLEEQNKKNGVQVGW
jgi:peptidyl-dipeptidase A